MILVLEQDRPHRRTRHFAQHLLHVLWDILQTLIAPMGHSGRDKPCSPVAKFIEQRIKRLFDVHRRRYRERRRTASPGRVPGRHSRDGQMACFRRGERNGIDRLRARRTGLFTESHGPQQAGPYLGLLQGSQRKELSQLRAKNADHSLEAVDRHTSFLQLGLGEVLQVLKPTDHHRLIDQPVVRYLQLVPQGEDLGRQGVDGNRLGVILAM